MDECVRPTERNIYPNLVCFGKRRKESLIISPEGGIYYLRPPLLPTDPADAGLLGIGGQIDAQREHLETLLIVFTSIND